MVGCRTSKNVILYGNFQVCNKLSQNSNRISKCNREGFMRQDDCKRLELEQNGMQVVLEFPTESENEENIKREVKEILSHILQEYLTKNMYHSSD